MTDFIYDLMTTRQCFTFRRPHCIITLACNAQTLSSAATGPIDNRKAQIPLCSSRLDTIRSTCRAHAFCLCRACWTAQLARHVERVVSCRDVAWRAKWNLGLSRSQNCHPVWERPKRFRVLYTPTN